MCVSYIRLYIPRLTLWGFMLYPNQLTLMNFVKLNHSAILKRSGNGVLETNQSTVSGIYSPLFFGFKYFFFFGFPLYFCIWAQCNFHESVDVIDLGDAGG